MASKDIRNERSRSVYIINLARYKIRIPRGLFLIVRLEVLRDRERDETACYPSWRLRLSLS